MESIEPLLQFKIGEFNFELFPNIIVQWIIIAIVIILSLLLTRNISKIPGKKQTIAEILVGSINNVVKENMGDHYKSFVPLIGTFAIFILFMNLTPLVGVEPPTMDFSVTFSLAIVTFVVIQGYTIKKIGVSHYFLGYTKPMPGLLPLNIIERVMLPLSLSLRLFGNLTASAAVMGLIYKSLFGIKWVAQLGIPILGHLYFDIFDGAVQTIIFVMLTMINIKVISEH